jgi:hypothetical protein
MKHAFALLFIVASLCFSAPSWCEEVVSMPEGGSEISATVVDDGTGVITPTEADTVSVKIVATKF